MAKKPKATDWSSLAAYIDGEGCIIIEDNSGCKDRSNQASWRLIIRIANTDPRLPVWLKETFNCGYVHEQKRRNPKWRPCFTWCVSNQKAEWILRNCLKYFVIKREQAEQGLAFRKTITVGMARCGLDPKVIETRRAQRSRLQELKRIPFDGFIRTDVESQYVNMAESMSPLIG